MRDTILLYVNGREIVVSDADPRQTLLSFLRDHCGLKGTKLGCGEGGCGACTVMLSHAHEKGQDGKPMIRHVSANACLTPLCACDGYAITTIEGIGGMKQGLHPIQQRLSSMHGSQCGFCTPGIVMSLYAQLRQYPNSTPHELEECMDGNLCRCTGYRPIIDAARSLSNNLGESKTQVVGSGGGCCQGNNGGGGCPCKEADSDIGSGAIVLTPGLHTFKSEDTVNGTLESLDEAMHRQGYTEPIFPPALLILATDETAQELCFQRDGFTWHQPFTLNTLCTLKLNYPKARLVVGNTEVGIETKFKAMEYPTIINPSRVPELCSLNSTSDGVIVGAAVTINAFRKFIGSMVDNPDSELSQLRGLIAIKHQFTWFASNQIRNVACVGGNVVTASPISDLNPMLIALNAVAKIVCLNNGVNSNSTVLSSRNVPLKEFFLGYRRVDLEPNEVLESIFIPFTAPLEFVVPLKQARRREDDISIVTGCVRVLLDISEDKDNWSIANLSYALGGMAPTAVSASNTETQATGKTWSADTFDGLYNILKEELTLPDTVPGGQPEYRTTLAVSFLFRSFLRITQELQDYLPIRLEKVKKELISKGLSINDMPILPSVAIIPDEELSAQEGFLTKEKPMSRGEQNFHVSEGNMQHANPKSHTPSVESKRAPVGQPLMHRSAELQVTGEAAYTNDIAVPSNTLHAVMVTSTKAHAKLLSVDTSEAEKCPGYHSYINKNHIPKGGHNMMGAIVKDEELFADDTVRYFGMMIGVVLADTHEQAVYAARKVKVEYEELPAAVSIDEAIAAESFFSQAFGPERDAFVEDGDVKKGEAESDIIVNGIGRCGPQEHFYLETNCSIAIPMEHGQMEIFASTQNVTKTQAECAAVCGMPMSKVVCRCKRMGGGFGGKEERSIFITAAAAVACQNTGRAVSILIERDVDMSISGQRHSFRFDYKAGMDKKTGKLKFMDTRLYCNAGWSLDLSYSVMYRALLHADNCYKWPHMRVHGTVCKTNQPSHTAFRGFGGPQGMMVAEFILEHLSKESGWDLDELRANNWYNDGELLHYGQRLEGGEFHIPRIWNSIHTTADIMQRKEAVSKFNNENKWKKRGISVLPTKFGINFNAKFLNQGGALVHVYNDGTVLVSHGGTEMGQGLFTKMVQVAAACFHISPDMVTVQETNTSQVPNSSPTAASMSTDLYGMAVLDACEQIVSRLASLKDEIMLKNGKTWNDQEWINMINTAYFTRVNLSAQGFYIVPDDRCSAVDWNKRVNGKQGIERGKPFNYFTQGVACTEVEIDCLTGDHTVIRSDVLMDVGKSINPAIDIGQIEGAFVQGQGWSTIEDLAWGDGEHKWIRPGQLFTRGPGTYKIPAFNDVPQDFRVHLYDTANQFCVHSSKAVGEPPFFLGTSVFFAVRAAVDAARTQRGQTQFFDFQAPATSERIRMACIDDFTTNCMLNGNDHKNFQTKGSW